MADDGIELVKRFTGSPCKEEPMGLYKDFRVAMAGRDGFNYPSPKPPLPFARGTIVNIIAYFFK